MKKNISVLTCFFLLFILGACGKEKIEVQNASADFGVIFDDLDLLSEYTDIIVEAKYTGNTEIIPFPESGDPTYEANLSEIVVEKVYKGNVAEQERLWVSEPGALKDDTYETIEGYVNMNENGDYILFISEFDMEIDGKTVYSITGAHQGKFDLSIEVPAKSLENPKYDQIQKMDYFGGLAEQYNKVKEQVVEEFENK